jgi:hypothetical protein
MDTNGKSEQTGNRVMYGEDDPLFPLAGMRRADARLRERYAEAGGRWRRS